MKAEDIVEYVDYCISCIHNDMGGFDKSKFHIPDIKAKEIKRMIIEYREVNLKVQRDNS